MKLFGGIETGGTKFICAIGDGPDNVVSQIHFPTTTPDETIGRAINFFKEQMKVYEIASIGIGTFGPVDLDELSATYGYITTTPKPGWSNTNLIGRVQQAISVPVLIDTDVNAAALGEHTWGNAIGLDQFVYYTIGTGIGMGGLINGSLLHGHTHPEAGHMIMKHDLTHDPFPGACTYHKDCFEGLATGLALQQRWGQRSETLPDDHPAWELEAYYIAQAMVNTILMLSPKRIILGGGVMKKEFLFPIIRSYVIEMLKGYVRSPLIQDRIEELIVPAKLGDNAGVLGSIALAMQAVKK
jgi:fructokinase